MMIISCHNEECPNAYAPYTSYVELPCNSCGNEMTESTPDALEAARSVLAEKRQEIAAAENETKTPELQPPTGPFDPPVPASVAVQTAVAAAMATVGITSPSLTGAQRDSIQSQVTAQVQSVIDANLP